MRIKRLLQYFFTNIEALGVRVITLFLIISYAISYSGMFIFEPAMTKDFFWFFIVTVTTVGYGDIHPLTTMGKFVGIFIIVFGGILYTIIITYIYIIITKVISNSKKGLMKYDLSDHIVIIGYNENKTVDIIHEIKATRLKVHHDILLCVINEEESFTNPLEKDIKYFIKAWTKTKTHVEKLIEKTNLHKANAIIFDLENDNQALSLFLDIQKHSGSVYKIVALNNNRDKEYKFKALCQNVECVNSQEVGQIITALENPGAVELLNHISLNSTKNKLMRLNLSHDFHHKYINVFINVKKHLNAQVIGVAHDHACSARVDNNPENGTKLTGKAIFYISDRVLTEKEIEETFKKIEESDAGKKK